MHGIQLEIQTLYCTKSQLESHVFVVMHSSLNPHSDLSYPDSTLPGNLGSSVSLQHATKDTANMVENCPLPLPAACPGVIEVEMDVTVANFVSPVNA